MEFCITKTDEQNEIGLRWKKKSTKTKNKKNKTKLQSAALFENSPEHVFIFVILCLCRLCKLCSCSSYMHVTSSSLVYQ